LHSLQGLLFIEAPTTGSPRTPAMSSCIPSRDCSSLRQHRWHVRGLAAACIPSRDCSSLRQEGRHRPRWLCRTCIPSRDCSSLRHDQHSYRCPIDGASCIPSRDCSSLRRLLDCRRWRYCLHSLQGLLFIEASQPWCLART